MESSTKNITLLAFKDDLIRHGLDNYRSGDQSALKGLKRTGYYKKTSNEKNIQKLLNRMIMETEPYRSMDPKTIDDIAEAEIKALVISHLLAFEEGKYLFDQPFLKFFLHKGFLDTAEAFIKRAHTEDGSLTAEELFQAMRNVWIMNSLQLIWGIPVELTDSVYAYSMLYPYTDNFLDDPDITHQEKAKFNQKLSKALRGEAQTPSNVLEQRVFELVTEIELQYPRKDYPGIYESIQLIQAAQIESLRQDQSSPLAEAEILPLTFFKGGSSVLGDAFLVKGGLSKAETEFAFEFGAFLQLLDDLQDTQEDRAEGHQTIFSQPAKPEEVDEKIHLLIAYVLKVTRAQPDDSEVMAFMKQVIQSCTLVMVMDAVQKNRSLVSAKFYRQLESRSKVHLAFYGKLAAQIRALIDSLDLSMPISEINGMNPNQ